MKTKVEICHIDSNRCVVRVSGFDGERDLGSSLGEAADAEEAEDRARQRLEEREMKAKQSIEPKRQLQPLNKKESEIKPQQSKPASVTHNKETGSSDSEPSKPARQAPPLSVQTNDKLTVTNQEPSEAPTDPEDWSEELTAIDLQLKRIRWTREHESEYLERAYGHGSRHKLTRYSDLVSYLNKLKSFDDEANAGSAPTPLRRSDLITQGDEMLTTLQWDQETAKNFLQTKLGATSRQQLSDEQLFEFNMLLEEQLISVMPNQS